MADREANSRFRAGMVEARLEAISESLKSLDAKMDRLIETVHSHEKDLAIYREQLSGVQRECRSLHEEVNGLNGDVEELRLAEKRKIMIATAVGSGIGSAVGILVPLLTKALF